MTSSKDKPTVVNILMSVRQLKWTLNTLQFVNFNITGNFLKKMQ